MAKADPKKLKVAKQISRSDILLSIARNPNTSQLYVGSNDFHVYGLDPMGKKVKFTAMQGGHQSYVTGVALAKDKIVSGGYDGKLIWSDAKSGKQLHKVGAHTRWIRRVRATSDGKYVVSVADDMVCRIWDVEKAMLARELRGHKVMTPHNYRSMMHACAISPDNKYLATADKVGHVVVWDFATGKQLVALDAPKMYTWDPRQRIHSIGGIRALAFSPDNKQLAVGGIGQIGNIDHLGAKARLEVFDWQKKKRTHEFKGEASKGIYEHLAFHHKGEWLVGAGGDHAGFIKFIDLKKNKVFKETKAPMHVHDMVLNETSDTIYAAGHGKVVVWTL